MTQTKVAWIRDPGYPIGKPAPGRLNCACKNAPTSVFNASQGYVACTCGMVYTWDGYVVNTAAALCTHCGLSHKPYGCALSSESDS